MITAIFLAIKAFSFRIFPTLANIAAFIIDRWRVFLPLAIVGATLWCLHSLRVERDAARAEFSAYRQEIFALGQKKRQQNLEKEAMAQAMVGKVIAQHAFEIGQLKGQYDATLKKQGTAAAAAVDRRNDDWRERLRLELAAAADRGGGCQVPGAAGGTAESGGDGHPADPGQTASPYIDTLESACAITTSDYNALWNAWERACKVHRCVK